MGLPNICCRSTGNLVAVKGLGKPAEKGEDDQGYLSR